jgi:hypothetical protein
MSLEEYSFLFDVLSAISVVISLVYLGYQIRQNTRAMRRTVAREITRDLNELGRYFIEMPDLIDVYFKANDQPKELNAAEQFRFQILVMTVISNFDLAIGYHKDGLIGEASIDTYAQSIHQLFRSPIVEEWWHKEGHVMYSAELCKFVEKGLAA